jgi:hypothetical protein
MRPVNPTRAARALKMATPAFDKHQSRSRKGHRPPEIDEAFLLEVDRAVVLGKPLDPYRLTRRRALRPRRLDWLI